MTGTGIGGSGYDLEELSAYADRGRFPAIAAIDDDPECQAVLDSIDRLGALQRDLVDEEAARLPAPDERWFDQLLSSITREVRAGRDVDFPADDPDATVVITEGAIREAIRVAGDSVDGVLVGRVRLRIDPADGVRAEIGLDISVLFARRALAGVADEVRQAVHAAVLRSTPLVPTAIDVTIDDIRTPGTEAGR